MRSQTQDISATEKQRQALELRKAGVSYADIAEIVGYKGQSGAHAAVKAALFKTIKEPADELRQLECERLDVMLKSIWPSVLEGSNEAVDRAIKIIARRAALLGLDAPTKVAPTTPDGTEQYDGITERILSRANILAARITEENGADGGSADPTRAGAS